MSSLVIVNQTTPGTVVAALAGGFDPGSAIPTAATFPFFTPPSTSSGFSFASFPDASTSPYDAIIAAVGYRNASANGSYVEYTNVLFKPGSYTLLQLNLLQAPDGGIVTIKIDGNIVGVYDSYAASLAPAVAIFDSLSVVGNTHTVRFEVTAKNGSSTGYHARFLAFSLSPGNAGG